MLKKSLLPKPKSILFLTVMIDLIGFGIIIPLTALYGSHFGGSAIQLAILSSIYSLMQFIFAPFWGGLSDRIGRRPVLLISSGGLAVSYLIFGLAEDIYTLIFSRAFAGLFAANIAAAQAYMADITPIEKRTESMGLLGAAFGLGFVLGPPLGAFSSAYLGFHAPGIIAFVICSLNCLVSYFRLPESLDKTNSAKNNFSTNTSFINSLIKSRNYVLNNSILIFLFVTVFFTVFFFSGFEQTLSLAVKVNLNVDTKTAVRKMGIIMMCMGFLGIIMQGYVLRKIKNKFRETSMLTTGLIVYSISTFVLSRCDSFTQYIVACCFISLASSLINPSVAGLLSKSAEKDNQGLVMGISQGFSSLARVFGPFVGIYLFHYSSIAPFYMASFGCVLLLIFTRVILVKKGL